MNSESDIMDPRLESALDHLRAEGWGAPEWGPPSLPTSGPVGPAGRFLNQCLRCLEFKSASKVVLSRNQRTWLCEDCSCAGR